MESVIHHTKAIDAGASLARAYLLMEELKLDQLPVVSEDKIVGVVTLNDIESFLSHYFFNESNSKNDFKVVNYMKSPVQRVEGHCELSLIIEMMLEKNIGAITVMDDEKLLGILTRESLLKILAQLLMTNRVSVIDSLKLLECSR